MKRIVFFSVFLLCACSAPSGLKQQDNTSSLAVEVGALDKALELAKAAAQMSPNNASRRFQLADIYHRLKRYDMENNELNVIKTLVSGSSSDERLLNLALMRNSLFRNDYDFTIELYDQIDHANEVLTPEQQGNRLLYLAIAWCKKGKYEVCLDRLGKARELLPGDERVAQNIQLANWMSYSRQGSNTDKIGLLYNAYNENQTPNMFSNLVLSLVKEGDYGRAFELLSTRYSTDEANLIVNDLKQMRI